MDSKQNVAKGFWLMVLAAFGVTLLSLCVSVRTGSVLAQVDPCALVYNSDTYTNPIIPNDTVSLTPITILDGVIVTLAPKGNGRSTLSLTYPSVQIDPPSPDMSDLFSVTTHPFTTFHCLRKAEETTHISLAPSGLAANGGMGITPIHAPTPIDDFNAQARAHLSSGGLFLKGWGYGDSYVHWPCSRIENGHTYYGPLNEFSPKSLVGPSKANCEAQDAFQAANPDVDTYYLTTNLTSPYFNLPTKDAQIAAEDQLIQYIAENKNIVINSALGTATVPATNCKLMDISGSGQGRLGTKKIIFMRGSTLNMTSQEFADYVASLIADGFLKTDPFKTYSSQLSFYVDLKKYTDDLAKTVDGPNWSRLYPESTDNDIKASSSCGAHEYTYVFINDMKDMYPAYSLGHGVTYIALSEHTSLMSVPVALSIIHEIGHAVANLNDEYVGPDGSGIGFSGDLMGNHTPTNCTINPFRDFYYLNQLYGSTDYAGCGTHWTDSSSKFYYRASPSSLMNGLQWYDPRFNTISCGYLVASILGEPADYDHAKIHWPAEDRDPAAITALNPGGTSAPGCGPTFDAAGKPSQGPMNTTITGIDPRNLHTPGTIQIVTRSVAPGFAMSLSATGLTRAGNSVSFTNTTTGQEFISYGNASPDGTSLTFSSPSDVMPGTYTIRVAARNSAWSSPAKDAITVTSIQPPSVLLQSTQTYSGAVISWVTAGVSSCYATSTMAHIPDSFSNPPAFSGSFTYIPTANDSFALGCNGPGGSATSTAVVTAMTASGSTSTPQRVGNKLPPEITSLSPAAGKSGDMITVTAPTYFSRTSGFYSPLDVNTAFTFSGNSVRSIVYPDKVTSGPRTGVQTTATFTVPDLPAGSYSIEVSNGGVTNAFTFTIMASPSHSHPLALLSLRPSLVQPNQPVTLSWGSANASSCTGTTDMPTVLTFGQIGLVGSLTFTSTPNNSSYTFVLSCTGPSGTSSATTTLVTSTDAPLVYPTSQNQTGLPSVSFQAFPSQSVSVPSKVMWSVSDASSCILTGTGDIPIIFGTPQPISFWKLGHVGYVFSQNTSMTLSCTGIGGTSNSHVDIPVPSSSVIFGGKGSSELLNNSFAPAPAPTQNPPETFLGWMNVASIFEALRMWGR